MKTSESMPLGIVLERRESDNPWQPQIWTPVAVIPGAPAADAWKEIACGEGWSHVHVATLPLDIFRDETEDYAYNLVNDPPSVYVVLREDEKTEAGVAPFKLTVAPSEAQVFLDAEENLVEPVPMPDVVKNWLAGFVQRYHIDQPVHKRKRTPHDPQKENSDRVRRGTS